MVVGDWEAKDGREQGKSKTKREVPFQLPRGPHMAKSGDRDINQTKNVLGRTRKGGVASGKELYRREVYTKNKSRQGEKREISEGSQCPRLS